MPWAVADSLMGKASIPTELRMWAGLLPVTVTVTRSASTWTVHHSATGLTVAGIHAVAILRGNRSAFHRLALGIALTLGAPAAIGGAPAAIPSFLALRKFSDVIHPRLGEMVRANWSGDADSLPTVLTMALEETEREARSQGLSLDRDLLKKVVELSLSKHHVTKGAVLHEALKKVA